MKTPILANLCRSLFAAALLVPVLTFGQASTVQVPSHAKTVDPTLKASADTAHAAWKQDEGKEFGSGLTYVDGVPNLMLITTKGEPAAKLLRRQRAIVAACDFLLDDAAFAKLVITVVEVDPAKPTSQTTSTVEILRGNFKEAVQDSAKSANAKSDAKAATREAKETDSVLRAVSAKLGLK